MTKLESIRKRLGLSRGLVAAMAKISEQTVYLYETGRGGRARVLVQEAIATALSVKPETLFKDGKARTK